MAEAKDEADGDQSEGPPKKEEVEVKGDERQLKLEEVELVGHDRDEREDQAGEDDPAEPHQEHCADIFRGSDWCGEDVQQVAGPHVLEE